MSSHERCAPALRSRHRRLVDALGDQGAVDDVILLAPEVAPHRGWTTRVVLAPRWASVPAEVLEAIAGAGLGIGRVEPQGEPAQLVVEVR